MIIDFTTQYDLMQFRNCILCNNEPSKIEVFDSNQYRCFGCKIIIEQKSTGFVDGVWVGWNDDKAYIEQPGFWYFSSDTTHIISYGETIKELPPMVDIDIKKFINNIENYKLLL